MPNDHDRQLLAHLGQQPGWQALRRAAEERMEREFRLMAHALMRPEGVSEEKRHHARGFFAGMKFLLDNPTLEAKKLEKALREEE